MPIYKIIRIIFGKEDIIKDCKYCKKTDSKSIFRTFAGYECIIKYEKRNCNRCKNCYFGRHKGI